MFNNSIPEDKYWLSPFRVLIRECIELSAATKIDIQDRSKRGGTKIPIKLGQVGLRCKYCANMPSSGRTKGAVSFPHSIRVMHQSVRNWQRYHFVSCKEIPQSIRNKFRSLQSLKSPSANASLQYWYDSARFLGLINTSNGIFFGESVPLPKISTVQIEDSDEDNESGNGTVTETKSLVHLFETVQIPKFMHTLFDQFVPIKYKRSDNNKSKEKSRRGYACIHCDRYDSPSKFFVHNSNDLKDYSKAHLHIMKCFSCPDEVKSLLILHHYNLKDESKSLGDWEDPFIDKIWNSIECSPKVTKNECSVENGIDVIDGHDKSATGGIARSSPIVFKQEM